ncbi:MAG TPA: phosphoribosylformylglycinamidine synthase, purS protein [Thermoplasmatales archaeon]|nr:phosphoribosylformylglycinamidine synthase, purS protein [Thermoplasmatales archaeon]
MFEVTIAIGLKNGITDPEGATTLKSLHLLGFDMVKEVRSQKMFLIKMDENDEKKAKEKVEEMCQKLLTNPVIHDYTITIKRI